MIPSSLYCQACGAANATDRSLCFACNQTLQVAVSDNSTLLQGRYRILTQVGKGGFGAVYRAEDTQKYGDSVAVKQINLRGLTPQETIEATDAFNREVSLLSNLSHPNLPHIYDNFTDPEHWYLVMDFIEGETLETYLEAKGANYTASLNEVLTLGIQLCTVLDYLHTREPVIIFRDLKPANIMRTPTGKLYLIDFGIARSFKPGKPKDTIPFGSPGYAAPEQYGKAQTTPRADIYSLGALLHMLLTGDDPVDNPFHFAPLRIYGVPGLTDLDALISRMVQIDANSRPATIVEVKDELQRITDLQNSPRLWHPPVGQTPPAFPVIGNGQQQISTSSTGQQQLYVPAPQRKSLARRKFLVGGFAITGLTIIGASGIANIVSALHESINMRLEPGGATSYDNASPFGNTYTYAGHTQPVEAVAWSLDNTLIASAGDDSSIQVWTMNKATEGATFPLYKYKTAVSTTCLAWGSNANSTLLAFNSGKTITIWDVVKNTTTSIDPPLGTHGADVSRDIHTFSWSPDGGFIAFPTNNGVQLWDVTQGKAKAYIDAKLSTNESITSLSWSNNENYIAASTVPVAPNTQIAILSVPDSSNTDQAGIYGLLESVGSSFVTWSPDSTCIASVRGPVVTISFISDNGGTVYYTLPNNVNAIAWSYDSRYIVAASEGPNANIYVWSPDSTSASPMIPLQINIPNESTHSTYVNTQAAVINSLAWSSSADGGEYLAIGADKAHLLEINFSQLNDQGQQGFNYRRRRHNGYTTP